MTIGIDPTFPSSAFGYIHLGDELSDHPGVSAVREFVEKPSAEVAGEYVASGRYRWNAGMFVVRPRVLLELLAESDPDFTATLREIVAEPSRLEELWPTLPKIALDHAVAKGPAAAAGRVVTVPASFGWDDIGDFDSLAAILNAADPEGDEPEGNGLAVLGEADLVQAIDSTGVVVAAGGKTIAVVGLDDIVVVDATPDALLVTTRARAQQVKDIVAALKAQGRNDLT